MDRFQIFSRLACMGVLIVSAGCQSEEIGQYQDFTTLPEVQTDANTDSLIDTAAATGNQLASDPQTDRISEQSGDSADADLVPLVAIKPVSGQNSAEFKTNIDNAATGEGEIREIKLLVDEPNLIAEKGAVRVSYDNLDLLKVLNMEPVPTDAVSFFPEWMNQLDGQQVRIRGFMYPPYREEGIIFFVLARDNQICCMGRSPKIYDLINVEMRDGVTTEYILNRAFDVVGTFRIRPEADDDDLFNLYEIIDAVVIDK